MTDSPLRAKGRAMRRNLMGAAYADKLDRQIIKYKDRVRAHPHEALKHKDSAG